MAGVAIGRHGCVVVIGVALRAGQSGMCAGQRKHRCVIECGRSPVSGRVAQSAICREAGRHVSGVRGPGKIRLVAAVAGRWQRCIVVIGMATRARNSRMCAGQRESRVVMVKGRRRPGRSVMAGRAGCGEADLSVIGICCAVVIRRVAGVAIRRHGCVVIVGMALSAWNSKMSPRQRKGPRRVIESGRAPAAG